MKLYLVRGNDVDGESQDWFVTAENPAQSIILWNEFMVENEWPREDFDDGDRTKQVDPSNVREILENVDGTQYSGNARVIEWEEIKLVA